ncbi:exopolysaccharide export protein VpsN [Opitutales bacterium ASA1]|uniref:polysaccharide biosynthesis/export family protein n=1 Tax=Congregicoccus parvus TaxID=3081749 RepID=UPI002B2980C4|nr:exopolysaccharide export protein VpsN [Opitutales bacterium ASA1]
MKHTESHLDSRRSTLSRAARRVASALRLPACLVGAAAIFATTTSANVPGRPDYRISPGDVLEFQVFEEPDTLISQRVTMSGELPVPMVGVVRVVDLTLREAEAKIRSLLVDGTYFIDPQVILIVKEYAERSVSILGQVGRPEQIPFPPETETLGIVRAITLAGGLTRVARADRIEVTRTDENGDEQRFTIDFRAYVTGRAKERARQFQLLPGDIVYVPERTF